MSYASAKSMRSSSSRVAEITGSDYFNDLKVRAGELRQMVTDQDARPSADSPSTDLKD